MALLAIHSFFKLSVLTFFILAPAARASEWIEYSNNGFATLTHYSLPLNYIASCGCTAESTHYPTAALSQMAFGSSTAYGPACGRCFNLTLLNTFLSVPPFYPPVQKSIVVKVTDLCPLSTTGWCNATTNGPNAAGNYLNFDLAYPSTSIPSNFFPSNASYYGYTDFGVWKISYESVSCNGWEGWNDAAALGSVTGQGPESVCCAADPTNSSNTCTSYSDHNGIAPDTTTSSGHSITQPYLFTLSLLSFLLLFEYLL
ncbi:RlpA-like double-psi beta-barrel-protein domain-containing protein-containing protein [Lentinula detonsa]|uniref:RlpA-like double-psi beta-barrel-protein domain-containing protein-containing protein n=1 Tax=Lentinula detonsa TaxID=2804962 RepID=A0AA38UYL1_9AGAR|nr:RlpA-like double-psi beta-barrel-protein domain-containing protein-containing protein [Lentinula detonsa]